MTPEEWANKMASRRNRIVTGPAFQVASKDALALQSRRIFVDGQKTDGGPLGAYSTVPMTASPKSLPKAGNQRGKTGNKTKTSYYAGGYRELRQQQGRESAFVNLRLSNSLQSDFLNAVVSSTSNSLGEVNPTVVNPLQVQLGLSEPNNILKLSGLQAKYGVFTDLSSNEIQVLVNSFSFQIKKILND